MEERAGGWGFRWVCLYVVSVKYVLSRENREGMEGNICLSGFFWRGNILVKGWDGGDLSFRLDVLFHGSEFFKKEGQKEEAKCFGKCQCNGGREGVISALFALFWVISSSSSSKELNFPAAHSLSPVTLRARSLYRFFLLFFVHPPRT